MKKRKGVIRYHFDDGDSVARHIDDKHRTIPDVTWRDSAEAEREWYKAQDALDEIQIELDEIAKKDGQVKGGKTTAQLKRDDAEKVYAWLTPLVEKAYIDLSKHKKRVGWQSVQNTIKANMRDTNPQKRLVSERRVKLILKKIR